MRTTSALLLRRLMGQAAGEDHIAWAVERLIAGEDSPSLRILAGLNPRWERHEIEPYFLRTCRELGVESVPRTAPPRETARLVQEIYKAGCMSPEMAVQNMAQLYVRSEYSDPVLSIWFEIQEEMSLGGSGHEGCFYSPDLLDPLDQAVVHEFELFSRALDLDLPHRFDRFIRCDRCSAIGAPKWRHKSIIDPLRAKMPWVNPGSTFASTGTNADRKSRRARNPSGQRIGTLATLGLVSVTGALGAYLARRQGLGVLRRVREEMAEGRTPAAPIMDGIIILIALHGLIGRDIYGWLAACDETEDQNRQKLALHRLLCRSASPARATRPVQAVVSVW